MPQRLSFLRERKKKKKPVGDVEPLRTSHRAPYNRNEKANVVRTREGFKSALKLRENEKIQKSFRKEP